MAGHMTMDVVGSAAFGVELRTQEAERGMNSEEAERLVWSAQTIFSTGCAQLSCPPCTSLHAWRFTLPSHLSWEALQLCACV